ncbi:hypothetical protein [Streptomyces sp. NBC_01506]|uniref:phage baseplate protein n=1 Tax=Streptomyces sp. NBC_01506 TaxID=2903887 RepID=UPI003864CB14
MATAGTAQAVVDPTQRILLEGNGDDPVVRKTLHQPYWAMQSFAFDHVHGHIYFVQTKVGSKNGDLWVTRTDLSGNVLGAMALHSFDHGSSMGVQPDTFGSPYLWLAGDWRSLDPDSGTPPNSHTIARVKYKDGGLIDYHTSPGVGEFHIGLSDFVDCPRPSIDPYTNRLLVRYMGTTSPWRLALFNLSDVLARGIHDDTPCLAMRALPTNAQLKIAEGDHFQGVAAYGQYAYLSYGAAPAHPSDPPRPSYLFSVDMNRTGGQYTEKFQTHAGDSLPGREPQGLAIWRHSSGPRLAFGFSSKIAVSPDEFQSTVFYKSDLAF